MTLHEAFNDCLKSKWLRLNPKVRYKWRQRFIKGELSEEKIMEILRGNGYSVVASEKWERL